MQKILENLVLKTIVPACLVYSLQVNLFGIIKLISLPTMDTAF